MCIYVLSMDCMNRNSYEDGEDSTAANPPAHHVWDPDVRMQDASDSDVEDASDSDVEDEEDETTDGNPGELSGHMPLDSRMLADRSSMKCLLTRLAQLNARWH
jgi:hypothetical protein